MNKSKPSYQEKPDFWKTKLAEIDQVVGSLSIGKASIAGYSAGNRPIHLVTYGDKHKWQPQTTYNSSLGAGDPNCYLNREEREKPVIFIICGVHGGEMEGIAASLNFLHILETGKDFRGQSYEELRSVQDRFRILIIPCANPDARSHVPIDSMLGIPFDEMRYYMQGTWMDGTLCGWPGCKTINPIKEHVDYLAGYYNDDGVNIAHDNWFDPMAEETKIIFRIVNEEAPDFTAQLHGGDNCVNKTIPISFVPAHIRKRQYQFDQMVFEACKQQGLDYYYQSPEDDANDGDELLQSFGSNSAIHHLCGGISLTYESNMGLDYTDHILNADEILDHHLIFLESIFKFTKEYRL